MSLNYQARIARPQQGLPYYQSNEKGAQRAKVLLVEDDRSLRRLVKAEIGAHCTLLMAPDISLGATLYKSERPDITFIDINLPDGSGYGLLHWILNMNPSAFNVMFSGHSNNYNVHKSIEAGAKGFVSKPFDPQKMMFFIRRCMES